VQDNAFLKSVYGGRSDSHPAYYTNRENYCTYTVARQLSQTLAVLCDRKEISFMSRIERSFRNCSNRCLVTFPWNHLTHFQISLFYYIWNKPE